MKADREKWEAKYRGREFSHDGPPSSLLLRWLPQLPRGRALDLATGLGRNALCLAEAGYRVDAVDISPTGLAVARRRARRRNLDITWIEADLDTYRLPVARYDVVVSTFFLKPRLFARLRATVRPGGVVVFETHLSAATPDGGPSNPQRLQPGVLGRRFRDWDILEIEEGAFREGGQMWALGRIVAQRPRLRVPA